MAGDLRTAFDQARRRLQLLTVWHTVAVCSTVLYTVWLAVRTTRNHFGLGTSAYDFGLFDQGV